MTSNIPPKQTVTGSPGTPNPAFEQPYAGIPEQPGALVSIHNAALHATPDSFPVLKAFQDYLEAERQRARRRLVLLSAFFAVLLIVVMVGLIAIGVSIYGDLSAKNDKLFSVLIDQHTAPAGRMPAETDASARERAIEEQVAARLAAASRPAPGASPGIDVAVLERIIEERVAARMAAAQPSVPSPAPANPQPSALDDIKATLAAIQKENAALRSQPTRPSSIGPLVPRSAVENLNPPPAAEPPPTATAPIALAPSIQPAVSLPLPLPVVAVAPAVLRKPLEQAPSAVAQAYQTSGDRLTVGIPGKNSEEPIPWRIVLPKP
ncbi:MAG: hypothetical protein WCG22_03275 [Lentisphaerota bacterium]|jgi:hypothetical protein